MAGANPKHGDHDPGSSLGVRVARLTLEPLVIVLSVVASTLLSRAEVGNWGATVVAAVSAILAGAIFAFRSTVERAAEARQAAEKTERERLVEQLTRLVERRPPVSEFDVANELRIRLIVKQATPGGLSPHEEQLLELIERSTDDMLEEMHPIPREKLDRYERLAADLGRSASGRGA
jgi:hypothetical protein